MLVCVVGTSTALTYWAFGVAEHAISEAVGPVHRVHCTSVADMAEQMANRGDRPVLFTTDFLEEKISRLIRESGAPVVVLVDTAEETITTAARLRRLDFLNAIRLASMYIVSLADVLLDPATSVFGPETRSVSVREFLPRFLSALRISHNPSLNEALLSRICPDPALRDTMTVGDAVQLAQESSEPSNAAETFTGREQEALRVVAEDYQVILDRGDLSQVRWPPAILHAATPNFGTEAPIELIGPARLLVWGPYMYLPKGSWEASMEFEVSGNHSANSVTADVLLGGQFASLGEFALPVRGLFTWNLRFTVDDTAKSVEVRLTLSKSAIEGSFFLREVRLFRQRDSDLSSQPKTLSTSEKTTLLPVAAPDARLKLDDANAPEA